MNVNMSAQTERFVPPAGSVARPWLWQIWAAVVVAFALAVIAHFAFKPAFAITPPTLSFLGDTCTVTFRTTNNTKLPGSTSLLVIAGVGTPGGDSTPPTYTEFARKTVSVLLAPKESKALSCEFPVAGSYLPNTVRVEIASYKNLIE